MLMLALVGMLRIVASEQAMVGATDTLPAQRRLADQLRRDLLNARHLQVQPQQLRLVGLIAQDASTRIPTLRPAEVTYRIAAGGTGNRMLVRSEVPLDVPQRPVHSDVVWWGATGIEVTRFDSLDDSEDADEVPVSGLSAMPDHLLIVVRGPDDRLVVSEEIFHHTEYP